MNSKIFASIIALSLALGGCVSIDPALDASLKQNVHSQVLRYNAAFDAGSPPIMIFKMAAGRPNSADGVDARIGFVVMSPKTIKYVRFSITAINRVGDPAVCRVRGSASYNLEFTGPVTKEHWEPEADYSCVVYNNTASFIQMDQVKVTYMDGTEEVFKDSTLPALFTDPALNVFASGVQMKFTTNAKDGSFEVSDRAPNAW
jgi:hypothetical protein